MYPGPDSASRKFRSIAAKDMRRSKARGTVGPGDWIPDATNRVSRNVTKKPSTPLQNAYWALSFLDLCLKVTVRNVGNREAHRTIVPLLGIYPS